MTNIGKFAQFVSNIGNLNRGGSRHSDVYSADADGDRGGANGSTHNVTADNASSRNEPGEYYDGLISSSRR